MGKLQSSLGTFVAESLQTVTEQKAMFRKTVKASKMLKFHLYKMHLTQDCFVHDFVKKIM